MNDTLLIVMDDGGGRFGPMTDLRATFEFRTGSLLTVHRIERVLNQHIAALRVPDRLRQVVSERFIRATVNQMPKVNPGSRFLVVNGRWSHPRLADHIATLAADTALVQQDGSIIAANLDSAAAAAVLEGNLKLPEKVALQTVSGRLLIARPWHILDELETTLLYDLNNLDMPMFPRQREHTGILGKYPIYVADGATILPMNVFDATRGPIVVERGAIVGSMAVLEGPCYVGSESTIAHHSSIRPNTVVGPVCKISGEVSSSIIHGYTNKAHHGYLGHAIVGQWVNLGAATNVSNLKNTMGTVRMQLEGDLSAEDTGRMFQGPLIGDYVRTAISTKINTGAVLGTGVMIACAGYSPKYNQRFTFHTDKGVEPYDMNKFIVTARAAMARRHCDLSTAEELLIRSLVADSA